MMRRKSGSKFFCKKAFGGGVVDCVDTMESPKYFLNNKNYTMNTAQKIIGAVLVTAAVGTSIVAAQTNNAVSSQKLPRIPQADRQKVISLVDAGDYNGWKALMTKDGLTTVADQVTADKFVKMTQLEKLEVQVAALRKEIGPMPGLEMGMMEGGPKMDRTYGGIGKQGAKFKALDTLPQNVKDQLKTAFTNHDKAAVAKILKDNGITLPTRPMGFQDKNVDSTSSTTQK